MLTYSLSSLIESRAFVHSLFSFCFCFCYAHVGCRCISGVVDWTVRTEVKHQSIEDGLTWFKAPPPAYEVRLLRVAYIGTPSL